MEAPPHTPAPVEMHRVPPAAPDCDLPSKEAQHYCRRKLDNGEMWSRHWAYCWVCLDGQSPAEQAWGKG